MKPQKIACLLMLFDEKTMKKMDFYNLFAYVFLMKSPYFASKKYGYGQAIKPWAIRPKNKIGCQSVSVSIFQISEYLSARMRARRATGTALWAGSCTHAFYKGRCGSEYGFQFK
jgi:hypothetical protein